MSHCLQKDVTLDRERGSGVGCEFSTYETPDSIPSAKQWNKQETQRYIKNLQLFLDYISENAL